MQSHDSDISSDSIPLLAKRDAEAVDAWMEARATGSALDASAERIETLLSNLQSKARPDRALMDVTLARVYRVRAAEARREPMLSSDDLDAVDAWSLSDHDSSRVPALLRDRADRLNAIGSLVTESEDRAPADLLSRTLAHVQAHVDAQSEAMRVETRRPMVAPRFRWADLVSVAATIMIGSAVVLPMISAARESNRQTVCKANLGQTALGLSTYAGSNRDALPMATAGLGGASWWDVNPTESHSNSSNLYTLAREGLVPISRLACPGNPVAPVSQPTPGARDWRSLEEVSYSYQIMFGKTRPTWNAPTRMVVLADRSPVILAAVRHELVDPCSNAPNHAYRGQHLLWTDGSVQWATSPVLQNGDNIWLPRPIERALDSLAGKPMPLEGKETPAGIDDVFLGP